MIFRRKPKRLPPSGSLQPNLPVPSGRGRRLGQAALYDRIITRIKEFPGPRHLIDVGCGAGILSLRLAQTCPELTITGIEPSTDLVRQATRAAGEAGLTARLRFDRADLASVPVPDDTADILVGAGILSETSSPQGFLSEVARVLAPGGTAILLEPVAPSQDHEDTPNPFVPPPPGHLLTEERIRHLIDASPLRQSARFARSDAEGDVSFLEITLTLPPPPEPQHPRRR